MIPTRYLTFLLIFTAAWLVSPPLLAQNDGDISDPLDTPAAIDPSDVSDNATPNVFKLPLIQRQHARLQVAIQLLFRQQRFEDALRAATQAIKLVPHDPSSHYNLACAQARLGKTEEAIASLAKAIELGFNKPDHVQKDADLQSLQVHPRFPKLVEQARTAEAPPSPWKQQVTPTPIRDGQAWVTAANTAWDGRLSVFRSFFTADPNRAAGNGPDAAGGPAGKDESSVVQGHGEAGERLRQWHSDGTAVGHFGVLYDNHDGDHSNLQYQQFPQLTRIEFDAEAKKYNYHTGLQTRFFFNTITFGNSSTALTAGPYWRSQARLAYTNNRHAALLYAQYLNSHLYIYPEHRDHDPGHNGNGGFGDVYPTNTPYLIISQGSSGSDRKFLDAIALTLAAFRPQVRAELVKQHTLMPTVQMIFRMSNVLVKEPADYLTGVAHPTVFEGKHLRPLQMVEMAQSIEKDTMPPMIHLKVIEEDQPVVGQDYFDIQPREKLLTTPSVIGRIAKSTQYERRMVVTAEGSRDFNDRPLTWHWAVLRGDADRIEIKPLNDSGSVVELVVPYHERRPIRPGSDMESNRVDIGVFVHNGKYYSPPGFVTYYFLDNEQRVYDDQHRIQSVQYSDHWADGGDYVDPTIDFPKTWRDEYQYDDAGKLIGWTRHHGDKTQAFTAEGLLIVDRDAQGRPATARKVAYAVEQRGGNKPPRLIQKEGEEIIPLQQGR